MAGLAQSRAFDPPEPGGGLGRPPGPALRLGPRLQQQLEQQVLRDYFTPFERGWMQSRIGPLDYLMEVGPLEGAAFPPRTVWASAPSPTVLPNVLAHELDHILAASAARGVGGFAEEVFPRLQAAMQADPDFAQALGDAHSSLALLMSGQTAEYPVHEYLALLRESKTGPQTRQIPVASATDPRIGEDWRQLVELMLLRQVPGL